MPKRTVDRSAEDGRFVTKGFADRHKKTTVKETVSSPRRGAKPRGKGKR